MRYLKFSNQVFTGVVLDLLPVSHWLSPTEQVALTPENAESLGYVLATERPEIYGRWLVSSGEYLTQINAAYDNAVQSLVYGIPDFERESWPKQEQEAKAQAADADVPTPYVDALAASRGVPRTILLSKILEKVSLYEAAHAYLTGLRQAKEDALKALDLETVTHEDVFAISLDFSLPGAPE